MTDYPLTAGQQQQLVGFLNSGKGLYIGGNDFGYFHKDHFVIYRDIVLDQDKIGKVYIQTSLGEIKARLRLNLIIVLFVLFMAILASFMMTARLQRVVSEPILHLAQVAQKISLKRDYSIRAQKSSEDELGLFTEQFNEMLTQIQNQNIFKKL